MKTYKFLVVSLALISSGAMAQLARPEPPSSNSSVNSVRKLVIPALPAGICTATNGNCVTAPQMQSYVNTQVPAIVAPMIPVNGSRAWTTYFLNTTRTGMMPYGGGATFIINPDGSIANINKTPAGNNDIIVGNPGYCSGSNAYNTGYFTLKPILRSAFDQTPVDWVVDVSGISMSYSICDGQGS